MPTSGPRLDADVEVRTLLRRWVAEKPGEPALVELGGGGAERRGGGAPSLETSELCTWAELEAASDRLARNLLDLGLEPGDRVASLMPNRPALVVHYLACAKAGLVATPLNFRYAPPEIDHALGTSGAALLLAHADRAADVAASLEAAKLRRGLVWYGGGGPLRFEELRDRAPTRRELPSLPASAPYVVFFTSGSTGLPKGVTHTLSSVGGGVASIVAGLGVDAGAVVLPGTSLSHAAAFFLTLAGLAAGARTLVARSTEPPEILALLRRLQPTLLCMLPAPLFAVVRDHGATRADFRSLRLCIAGGDKVSAELEDEFTALAGLPVEEVYGMTEIGYTSINHPAPGKPGSLGRLLPGYTAEVRDEADRELPAGREGRMWIEGPADMVGYWNDPGATAATIRDGWIDTGDVMSIDADGYLWFHGRRKQIIVHDGSNVTPQEVEEALLAHPAIENAAVVGMRDPLHGESIRAYLTIREGASRPAAHDLTVFARGRIAAYKVPEEFVFLTEMPLNSTGKVDRVGLKRRAEGHRGPA
jgi:acyl-coenzyme A synthetase/AMP-(fatty) acid ligase